MKKIIAILILSISGFLSAAQSSYWRDKVTNNKIHIFIEDKKCMVEYDNGLKVVLCDNGYYQSAYQDQFQVFDRDKEFELIYDEPVEQKTVAEVPTEPTKSKNVIIMGNYSLSRESYHVTLQNLRDGKIIAWSFTGGNESAGRKSAGNCFESVKKWMKENSKEFAEFNTDFAKSIYKAKGMDYRVFDDIIRVESRGSK